MIIVRIWRIHSVAAPDDISLVTALLITNACIVQSGIIQPETEEQGSNILTRLCNVITHPPPSLTILISYHHAMRCRPGGRERQHIPRLGGG